MGRPYRKDVAALPSVYQGALRLELPGLADGIRACSCLPLIAVGSGGSLSAASFVAFLHEHFCHRPAKAVTPLRIVDSGVDLRRAAVLFLSAGGSNPDVLGAFKRIVVREPAELVTLCTRPKTKLAQLAADHGSAHTVEFDLPGGKDGFLATKSLLASAVVLAKAYSLACPTSESLPPTLDELVHPGRSAEEYESVLRETCNPLWAKRTLIVLHGSETNAAAIDMESKFVEAALGPVLVADYRNFAHGRHYWLARHGKETSVLALTTVRDRDLARRTLRLLPSDMPVASLDAESTGPNAGLAALVHVMHAVGLAGEHRGADPGRPKVPTFGRKIYHLSAWGRCCRTAADGVTLAERAAIERKTRTSIEVISASGQLDLWRAFYRDYLKALSGAKYCAVVFDYDGTLCGPRERFSGPSESVQKELLRLLKVGCRIGVASGRGDSVQRDLLAFIPRQYWSHMVIGYHNGAETVALSEDERPSGRVRLHPSLRMIATRVRESALLESIADVRLGQSQVTIQPRDERQLEWIWQHMHDMALAVGPAGIQVLRSSHSVDIIRPGVSKLAVVEYLESHSTSTGSVLCIGDQGLWPGNDHELLRHPFSIGVDTVSSDPRTCWNLAPPGCRGPRAALYYMRSMRAERGLVRLSLTPRGRGGA